MKEKIKITIILTTTLSLLWGCSLLKGNNLKTERDVYSYIKKENGFLTPMDNMYEFNINCFDKVEDGYIKNEDLNLKITRQMGEDIVFENLIEEEADFLKSPKNITQGTYLSFGLQEDFNGEYFGSLELSYKKMTEDKYYKLKTIKTNQDFYPINKLPHKVIDNSKSICFVTVSW